MSRKPTNPIRINDKYFIYMKSYGWELHNHDYLTSRNGKKKVAKVTHHATLQQLCDWIINRDAGHSDNFESLLEALNKSSERLVLDFGKGG